MYVYVYILQALRLLNKTVFHPRVDGLEELLMNMTDIYSDLVYALLIFTSVFSLQH